MSSQDPDVDINVVSSPEQSPQPADYNSSRIKYQSVNTSATTSMSNRMLINTISDSSRLSPSNTPPDNGKTSGNSAGYTSFTISNILSRNDPKRDSLLSSNMAFIDGSGGTVHDAAMLSRYVCFVGLKVKPKLKISDHHSILRIVDSMNCCDEQRKLSMSMCQVNNLHVISRIN